jgi:hypothetical protein
MIGSEAVNDSVFLFHICLFKWFSVIFYNLHYVEKEDYYYKLGMYKLYIVFDLGFVTSQADK